MDIAFKRLDEVDKTAIMALMNNELVRRQMPLLKGEFTEASCDRFIAAKAALWAEHGYGPWAFVIDGTFAGWGGLQPEEGEVDLALVLHPDFWGTGKLLYKEIIRRAFEELDMESVTVLFPPSRTRIQGFLRLGFVEDKVMEVGNEQFIRYRLTRPE